MKKHLEILYLGQRIKRIRAEQKISQKEMAHILGTGVGTLSKIEHGILPSRLSCEILFRIQDQFGIQPKELLKPCPTRNLNSTSRA